MEHKAILELWKSYDKKLEEQIHLNRKNAEEINKIKAGTFITAMTPLKLFTVVVGLGWVSLVGTIVINMIGTASIAFLISAGLQTTLTAIAILLYVYQLVTIYQYNSNEPVIEAQKKLVTLKSTTLWSARLLLLQLPLWTTFYWNESMLHSWDIWQFIVQGIITAIFTYSAIWLCRNIKYENKDKKWFRFIFSGKEWDPVLESVELLKEIREFEKITEPTI